MTLHDQARRSRAAGLKGAAALVAVTCGAGIVYRTRKTAQDHRDLAPPGVMVDAGGHLLHLVVTGQDHGGPTVVLEAGGMATTPMWALIQPGIAAFARVVSYDRAGLGWSQPGPTPRDARTIAAELHTALRNARLPGPYIVVGGSLGGPYAVVFAAMDPDATAGVVLVDSSHPDQNQRLPPPARRALATLRVANRILPALASVGLTHLLDVTDIVLAGLPARLPADAAAHMRAFARWPGHWTAVHHEIAAFDASMRQMRDAMDGGRLRDTPVVVLTAPDNPGLAAMREPWLAMQRDLASALNARVHHVIDGAGHIDMATRPEPIEKVIQGVRDLVESTSPQRAG